jgi:hypothetical protein
VLKSSSSAGCSPARMTNHFCPIKHPQATPPTHARARILATRTHALAQMHTHQCTRA